MGFLKRHPECAVRGARLATALLAFGSAALIWAAFPPLDCGFFAWVALTPWLVMTGRNASRQAWLWSLLAGYALFVALLHWLRFVGPEGWVALALYCALYWPAATLLLRRLKRRGLPFALTAPVTFAAFEFIRGNFLTGFPFFFLAHTQYRYLPIVQIADITGVYGITFLIALVNGCLADLILAARRRGSERRSPVAGGLIGARVLVYARSRALVADDARVRLRAGCARFGRSRGRSWRSSRGTCRRTSRTRRRLRTQLKVLQNHVELSKAAIGKQVALVIWPETICPAPLNEAYDDRLIEWLAARADQGDREYAAFLRNRARR